MCFKYCVLKLLCEKCGLSFSDNRNCKLQTSKAPLKSQAQGTSLLTSAVIKKFAYRSFKDSKGSVISNELLKLKSLINTIPLSTAAYVYERGFTKMNIICNPLRTRLTMKHTSSLMFVSLSGPPVMLFEPLAYVKSWLVLNRLSAVNSQGPSRKQEVVGASEMKSL